MFFVLFLCVLFVCCCLFVVVLLLVLCCFFCCCFFFGGGGLNVVERVRNEREHIHLIPKLLERLKRE